MTANKTPATPEPGRDSTVEDWFGQSVERDRELAEELSEELPPEEAERAFEEHARAKPSNKRAVVRASIPSRANPRTETVPTDSAERSSRMPRMRCVA